MLPITHKTVSGGQAEVILTAPADGRFLLGVDEAIPVPDKMRIGRNEYIKFGIESKWFLSRDGSEWERILDVNGNELVIGLHFMGPHGMKLQKGDQLKVEITNNVGGQCVVRIDKC